jgi:hypothetical protein
MMDNDYNRPIENKAVRRLAYYIMWVVLTSSVLLAINTGLVFSLAQGIISILPNLTGGPHLEQFLIFVGPVFLLYLEWYVWDILTAKRVSSRGA